MSFVPLQLSKARCICASRTKKMATGAIESVRPIRNFGVWRAQRRSERRYLDRRGGGGDRRRGGVYIKRVLCKFFDPLNVPPSSSLHRQPPFRISPLVTEPSNGVKRAPITRSSHPSSPDISSRIVTHYRGIFSIEIFEEALEEWNEI